MNMTFSTPVTGIRMPAVASRALAFFVLLTVLVAGTTAPLAAQNALPDADPDERTTLTIAESVADSLEADGAQTYAIELEAGQFVFGVADQQSVDVVIEVRGPDGSPIDEIDVTGEGPEPFQFETTTAGVYTLLVTPFEEDSGAYSIRIDGAEPIAEEPGARVEQLVYRLTGDAPGIAIGIVEDGALTYQNAFGMADLTNRIAFEPGTPSNIGSVSKQFTAMAVLLLEQDGKLSLDDAVTTHLPEVKAFEDTVTIRHLLTHTSGYREIFNTLAMAGVRFDQGDDIREEQVVELVNRQPALQNAPGTRWNYNNTGYQLLADIIAKVSDRPFPEFMETRVFEPLGMTSTQVRMPRFEVVPGAARGYQMSDGTYREGVDLPISAGAGGIYSTLSDLAKWVDNFDTHTLGGREVYEKMTTPYVLASGDTTGYGLGVFVGEQRGLEVVQHGGSDLAHRAQLTYYPELDAGIIMMSNNATADGSLVGDITEAFFGDRMEPEANQSAMPAAADADTAAADTTTFDPSQMTAEDFETFVGRYELNNVPGFVLTFMQEDGTFYTQATGQPQLEIVPTAPTDFKLLAVEARLVFQEIEDGQAQSVVLYQGGARQVASRLAEDPWSPSPDSLAAYTGRYYSEELQTIYTLTVDDETLTIKHHRLDDIALSPEKEDQFRGSGFPIQQVQFERNDAGDVVALLVGNGRTTNVRFERMK